MEKVCPTCGEKKERNAANFYRDSRRGYSWRCKVCDKKNKKRSTKPRDHRRKNLKSRYGITVEEYTAILVRQGGGCAICGGTDRLHVDHCHDSGHVRGILCGDCNIMLGHARDSTENLRRAITYLENALSNL